MSRGVRNDISKAFLARVKEVLRYVPETGYFYWIKNTGKKRLIGRRAGYVTCGHWEISVFRKRIKSNRLAWFFIYGTLPPNDLDVDHKNRDSLDDRKKNLRLATRSQNNMNRLLSKNNSSGAKGVCWHVAVNKWNSYITVNQHQIRLGLFSSFADAVAIRKEAEKRYYGEFHA
jgi:HNH endonuclease